MSPLRRPLAIEPQGRMQFDPNDWVYFIALNSAEGREWAECYRRGRPALIDDWIQTSLDLLRRRKLAEARELLLRAEAAVSDPDASSIDSVLHHRFLAAWAYVLYLEEDFDGAERYLATADVEVRQVLEPHPFLTPLADRCTDFRLQSIRISRNRRRWDEMAERIGVMRRTLRDEIPLVTFDDGRSILFTQLIRFFDGLELGEQENRTIQATFNVDLRRRQFESLVHHLYLVSGFVIPYP